MLVALLDDHFDEWTVEELAAFPPDLPWQCEIIDGTLIIDGNPLTGEEWRPEDLRLFSDSNRFEVIDGLLFVNAQANPLHHYVADRLRAVLEEEIGPEVVVLREIGIGADRSAVGPDISVINRAAVRWTSTPQPASDAVLVVEVASPSSWLKDRTIKAAKYAEAGIPGYWRVEPDPMRVIAYALRDGEYVELGSWGPGETVTVEEPVRVGFDPAVLLP